MGNKPDSLHNINQKASLEGLENTNQHIEAALISQSEEEIKKNKLRLKASINAVRWLACQKAHLEDTMKVSVLEIEDTF